MDFQTIIVIGAIVLLIAYLVNRNQQNASNSSGQQGNERPTYDDPNVDGSGSFGRDRGNESSSEEYRSRSSDETVPSSRNDDPNIQGQGSFGRDRSSDRSSQSSAENHRNSAASDARERNPRNDDPNVEGQGSFGRDKR